MGSDFFVFLCCLGLEGGGRSFFKGATGSLVAVGLSPDDGDRGGVLWSSSLAPLGFDGDGDDD